MKVMEDKGEIHLTEEEHAAFVQCLRLSRKLDDMERLQLYFHGHTDAVAEYYGAAEPPVRSIQSQCSDGIEPL